jgi:hypothetical protein
LTITPVLLVAALGAFLLGWACARFFGRDGRERPRIETDLLLAVGERPEEFRLLCGFDGSGMDWGMVRFRYKRLQAEMWRDRGTVETRLMLVGADPSLELNDLLLALDGGPQEGLPAMTLEAAVRCVISRESDIAAILSRPEGRAKVKAVGEAAGNAREAAFRRA